MTENAAVPTLTDEEVRQKTEDILEALRDVVDPETSASSTGSSSTARHGPPWT
jgi:hypothetical protein